MIIFKQINGKKNMGLLIAVYVVFTGSMTTAFLGMWPGTIMWAEVMFIVHDGMDYTILWSEEVEICLSADVLFFGAIF